MRREYQTSEINRAVQINLQSAESYSALPVEYTTDQSGEYRIQDNAAVGYLIYIGVNGPPDFTKTPASFSASLPVVVSWPLPGSGIQSLYIVPRYRNSYGCISQNSNPWIIRLTPTGKLLAPLPLPEKVGAYPKANGNINVMGQYPTRDIEQDPANRLRIWVDTDVNAAYTHEATISANPYSIGFGSYAPGTYQVAVCYYRTTDGALSSPVYTEVIFPDIPDALTPVYTENITP